MAACDSGNATAACTTGAGSSVDAQPSALEQVAALIARSQRILVVVGAGISTSCGIPDFRSAGSGLYERIAASGLLESSDVLVSEPQEVFDVRLFREDPSLFYAVAGRLLYGHFAGAAPTLTHRFLAQLARSGKLLRLYTQNVDGLEHAVCSGAIPASAIVQCHGSLATATCMSCGQQYPAAALFPYLKAGVVARCSRPGCKGKPGSSRAGPPRKRRKTEGEPGTPTPDADAGAGAGASAAAAEAAVDASAAVAATNSSGGVLKPNAIFFHEPLPAAFHQLLPTDVAAADCLLVLGTSLRVEPVCNVPHMLQPGVPTVLINREILTHTGGGGSARKRVSWTAAIAADCDEAVAALCEKLSWTLPQPQLAADAAEGGGSGGASSSAAESSAIAAAADQVPWSTLLPPDGALSLERSGSSVTVTRSGRVAKPRPRE